MAEETVTNPGVIQSTVTDPGVLFAFGNLLLVQGWARIPAGVALGLTTTMTVSRGWQGASHESFWRNPHTALIGNGVPLTIAAFTGMAENIPAAFQGLMDGSGIPLGNKIGLAASTAMLWFGPANTMHGAALYAGRSKEVIKEGFARAADWLAKKAGWSIPILYAAGAFFVGVTTVAATVDLNALGKDLGALIETGDLKTFLATVDSKILAAATPFLGAGVGLYYGLKNNLKANCLTFGIQNAALTALTAWDGFSKYKNEGVMDKNTIALGAALTLFTAAYTRLFQFERAKRPGTTATESHPKATPA